MKQKVLALLIAATMAVQCLPAAVYGAEFSSGLQETDMAAEAVFSSGNNGGYEDYDTSGMAGSAATQEENTGVLPQGTSEGAVFSEDAEQTGSIEGSGNADAGQTDTEETGAGSADTAGSDAENSEESAGDCEIFSSDGQDSNAAETETLIKEVYQYQITNGEIIITGYTGKAETVTVPETIDGYPVTAIGEKAFAGCICTQVELPEGIKSIGAEAFAGCENLIKVILPASIAQIGEKAFDSSEKAVLFCYAESYALQYAQTQNLACEIIDEAKTDIAVCDIQIVKSITCTGKALTPAVTVRNAGETLVLNQDYTLEYTNNTLPGTAVVTVTGMGKYEGTAEKTFTITLAVPKMVSAVSKGYNSVQITWKAVPGAESYQIYYKGNNIKTWKRVAKGVTATSFRHTSSKSYPLVTGKKYTYMVKAVYKGTESGYEKAGKSVTPTLTTPKMGSVKSAAYNKLKITWSKVPGATGYYIYRKSGNSWKYIASTKGTSYTHKSSTKYPVKTGVTYAYTVKAIRKTGSFVAKGAYNKTGIKGKSVPDKPVLVSAECTAENRITIRWKKAAGATNYLIYRKVPKGKWELVKNVSGANMIGYTHVSSSRFPIVKGKTYIYTVQSYTTTGKTKGLYDTKGLTAKALTAAAVADAQARKNAQNVVTRITNAGMTQAQKLKVCFDWVMAKPYVTRRTFSNVPGWPAVFANDHFVLGGGNCHSDAAAFAYLAKALGYTNVYVCTDSDGTRGLAHSWAEVNGLVYDPLFAQAKSYYRYYGVSYRTYELDPILHIAI